MSTFRDFISQLGETDIRLNKDGTPDRRSKRAKELHERWTVNNPTVQCPVCYDTLTDGKVTTNCGHHFCITCFTKHVRESDDCPMCRASLANAKPKKPESMPFQATRTMLSGQIQEHGQVLIADLYKKMHYAIFSMEQDLAGIRTTRSQETRQVKENEILSEIAEHFYIYGLDTANRLNLWHTGSTDIPVDPAELVHQLPDAPPERHPATEHIRALGGWR